MNTRADEVLFDERRVECDDTWNDADWDELVAGLPEDIESEPHAFSTGDYPSPEAGMAALWNWLCTLGNGVPDEKTCPSEPDAARA